MPYDRNNVFARILRGELPCSKVYENEHVLAFRDINPQAPVHVVVIPKGEYVSVDDFSANAPAAELAAFLRAVGRSAHQEGVAEAGYRILAHHGAAGPQDVPHFHLHLFGGRGRVWQELAPRSSVAGLAELQTAAGKPPASGGGLLGALHDEGVLAAHDDCQHREDRPVGITTCRATRIEIGGGGFGVGLVT